MKLKTPLILSAALILSACASHTKVKMERPNESVKIAKVCIIRNPKAVSVPGLDKAFAAALSKHGIISEVVDAGDRTHAGRKLYSDECPYNLRYFRVQGSADTVYKMDAILRTPAYGVSTVGYTFNDEPHFRKNPDLQRQIDGITARLLNKTVR